MRAVALLASLAVCVCAAEAGESLFYSKYFKGSVPEYVAITVDRNGAATYREAPDDTQPLTFQLAASDTAQLFALADKLDKFTRPLEAPVKVANMGMKTFRYEGGAKPAEVKFNYSEDPDARALADWFERIAETEQDYVGLERAVKFDKLGVNEAILRVQITRDRKRLVAPEQFVPLLGRVAKNDSYMHMSRERAAALVDSFQNESPSK